MGLIGLIRKDFSNNDDFHFAEFDFKLEAFSEYLRITNLTIQENLKTYLALYNEYRMESEDFADFYFNTPETFIKEETLQLYYSSIIISLFAFLEQSLFKLCKITEKSQAIKISDISGKGIFQYRKYLEKVIGIDFTIMSSEWNVITQYNHLRNHFVHTSNYKLDKTENKKRINSIKKIKGIKVTDWGDHFSVEFENETAIENFIITIKTLLTKIYFEDYENML